MTRLNVPKRTEKHAVTEGLQLILTTLGSSQRALKYKYTSTIQFFFVICVSEKNENKWTNPACRSVIVQPTADAFCLARPQCNAATVAEGRIRDLSLSSRTRFSHRGSTGTQSKVLALPDKTK